jgi:rfaE bifunctional protein nucleotidyltransferase chain/domain
MGVKSETFNGKIVTFSDIDRTLQKHRENGAKIVQCHGVFDLIHPGHIRHFSQAKKLGDVLVVSITKDKFVNKGPGRPAFSEHLRAESLAALSCVDYVVINETPTAVEAIRAVRPNFYVKGPDYADSSKDITQGIRAEEATVKECGGEIAFTDDVTFSSTQIINSFFGVYSAAARKFLDGFKVKHSADQIMDRISGLENLKVLLIGDTIVDEYRYCQPLGKSPKETIVSTRFLNSESFPGGIVACANHIASFSSNVTMVTCLGAQDSKMELIGQQLNERVSAKYFIRPDAPTTTKIRYVEPAFLTKMFQVAYLNDTVLPEDLENEICDYLREQVPHYDLVFVADYGHGMMTPKIRELLMEKATFLSVNVQTNSANHGYNLITKYPKAHYISIDEPELRLAMGKKYEDIYEVVREFSERHASESVVTITRGHNGSLTCKGPNEIFETPCFSSKVVDRVGAGDAYYAVTAMLAAQKAPIDILGFTGNAAGAMAVEIVCNRTAVTRVPYFKFIKAALQ